MTTTSFENLPYDVSRKMMLDGMSLRDVLKLCSANKQLNEKVCTEDFWRLFAVQKFNSKPHTKPKNYKTWKSYVIHLDYIRELDKRVNDLVDHLVKKSGLKLKLDKKKKFWYVKGVKWGCTEFRIVVSTGDLLNPSGKKLMVNVLKNPYCGKGNIP